MKEYVPSAPVVCRVSWSTRFSSDLRTERRTTTVAPAIGLPVSLSLTVPV